MIKVDVVCPVALSSPDGISSVIRTLAQSSEIFASRGITLKVFPFGRSLDLAALGPARRKHFLSFFHSIKPFLSRFLEVLAAKSFLFGCASVFLRLIFPAWLCMRRYRQLGRNPDFLLFHDIFTAYCFRDWIRNENVSSGVVIHSDGDSFRQLCSYWPLISGTSFHLFLKKMEATVLSSAQFVGFVSEQSRSRFLALHPNFPPSKAHVFVNGVFGDISTSDCDLGVDRKQINLVCVGSIVERKGQEYAIRALKLLESNIRSRLVLWFVGGGQDLSRLKTLSVNLGVSGSTRFLGSRADVRSILAQMSAFFLLSSDEGMPMAILEAMACGLPILSCPVGGIPSLISEGKSGWLIERSETAFAGIVEKIVSGEFNLEVMGGAARRIFESRYSAEAMSYGYASAINRVLASRAELLNNG